MTLSDLRRVGQNIDRDFIQGLVATSPVLQVRGVGSGKPAMS